MVIRKLSFVYRQDQFQTEQLVKMLSTMLNEISTVYGKEEMFCLTLHSNFFIDSYMASDMVNDHSHIQERRAIYVHLYLNNLFSLL